ncbi:MAG: acyltransferase family protein [Syntrophobacteraceae bacterium]
MARKVLNRLDYIDVMRVAASFAVVALHVSARVVNHGNFGSRGWWIGNLVDSATRWAVPVFVMISGSLLIDPNKDDSIRSFFVKRMPRLLIPLVFWSFFYLVYSHLKEGINLSMAVLSIVHGTPYFHLWYLYMAVGLYAVLIPIRTLCINADMETLIVSLAIILSIQFLYFLHSSWLIAKGNAPDGVIIIYQFIPYLPYLICGYFLRGLSLAWVHLTRLVYVLIGLILFIGGVNWFISIHIGVRPASEIAFSDFNPLIVLMSISIYLCIRLICSYQNKFIFYIKRICAKMAPLTLGVYVIHPIFMIYLRELYGLSGLSLRCFGIIPVVICVILLSIISSYLISKVPYLRRVIL